MKIELEIHNKETEETDISFLTVECDDDITVEELFKSVFKDEEVFLPFDNYNFLGCIDYYYSYDGKLHWDKRAAEMRVVDFEYNFPEYENRIPVWINLGGGIGSAGSELIEFAVGLYDLINDFVMKNPFGFWLLTLGAKLTIEKAIKMIKTFIDSKECVKLSSFIDSIYSKDTWKKEEIVRALDCNENVAKIVLCALGYKYLKTSNTFVINEKKKTKIIKKISK